jgi:glycosyltransferase involved in cell wall biosynthesis
MKISGFTFIRNGIKLKYPFIQSIQSILPVCDEMIVVVGNSEDGTRKAIAEIRSPKIKIIDTVWDDALRTGGKILAQQTDIAFDAITGDWGFYLQGDEVVHEKDLPAIADAAGKLLHDERVDGLLFPYYHFYGNYNYIAKPKTRGTYPFEVRMIRNNKLIRSFRDAQGFREFSSMESMKSGELPARLQVKKITAHIYHYGKVRGPKDELERSKEFHKLWHNDDWVKNYVGAKEEFEYLPEYPLIPFTGSHPGVMKDRIEKLNWDFKYDPSKVKISAKHRLMNTIEQTTGLSPFSFRNYKILP